MQSQLRSRFWALRWVNRAPDSLRIPGHGKNLTYEIHMNSQWTFASTGVFKMSVCMSLCMLVLMSLLVSPLKKDAWKLRGSRDRVVTHPTLHMIIQAKKHNCKPRTTWEGPQQRLLRWNWKMELKQLHDFQEGSSGAMPRGYPRFRAPIRTSSNRQLWRLLCPTWGNKRRNPDCFHDCFHAGTRDPLAHQSLDCFHAGKGRKEKQ